MRSDDPRASAAFGPLTAWFITDDAVRRSFRLHEIPGKGEQWSFRDQWVALATPGHARAGDLIQLVELTTSFAEAADAADDAIEVEPGLNELAHRDESDGRPVAAS